MRQIFLAFVVVALVLGGGPARANPQGDIRAVIQDQVDAFLSKDLGRAFDHAGPGIQNMFRTPENFGTMVQNGYPMVWQPEDMRFGDLRDQDGVLIQSVIVRDQGGVTHILEYRMGVHDGQWRIDGVRVVPAPGIAA